MPCHAKPSLASILRVKELIDLVLISGNPLDRLAGAIARLQRLHQTQIAHFLVDRRRHVGRLVHQPCSHAAILSWFRCRGWSGFLRQC